MLLREPERVRRRAQELEEAPAKAKLRAPEEDVTPLPPAGLGAARSHPALGAAFVLSGDTREDRPTGKEAPAGQRPGRCSHCTLRRAGSSEKSAAGVGHPMPPCVLN